MSVLRVGSRGAEVTKLQKELVAAGYSTNGVDGIFGQGTLRAVKAYQGRFGLSADGVVGNNTWHKLNTDGFTPAGSAPARTGSGPLLRQGASGPAVRTLQSALTTAGFSTRGVDGAFGQNTANAVKAFQRARGLTADGVVGPRTWAALGVNAPTGPSSPAPSGGTRSTAYVNGRPTTISVASVGNGQVMRSDAAAAYNNMRVAAASAGINLTATSGFRTMAQQQHLYDLYRAGRGNLAARPGYSNHQGGISMDIGGVGGYGTRAYNWLKANAGRHGFVNDVAGEYWHWTYKR